MNPILPRELLWTDKKTMDEFFKLDPISIELFDSFQTLREEPFGLTIDATKVFNELYYLVTRIVYEQPLPTDMRRYVAEIKADLGWNYSAELVMTMAYCVMSLNKSPNVMESLFRHAILGDFAYCIYWLPFENLLNVLEMSNKRFTYDFKPKPVNPEELHTIFISWRDLTDDFSLDEIGNVLRLWKKDKDKTAVASMIIDEMEAYLPSIEVDELENVKYRFRKYFKKGILDKPTHEYGLFCSEPYMSPAEIELQDKVDKQNKEKKALNGRIKELENENKRLNALLERKKRDGEARKFTLVEIVNYCKGCVEWEDVKSIVAMSNKLLRNSATEEDYKLVDSIEKEFKQRRMGNTYNAPVGQVVERTEVIEYKTASL